MGKKLQHIVDLKKKTKKQRNELTLSCSLSNEQQMYNHILATVKTYNVFSGLYFSSW